MWSLLQRRKLSCLLSLEPTKSCSIPCFLNITLFQLWPCEDSAWNGCFLLWWSFLRWNDVTLFDFNRLRIWWRILWAANKCFISRFGLDTTMWLIHSRLATEDVHISNNFLVVWDSLHFGLPLVGYLRFAAFLIHLFLLKRAAFVAIKSHVMVFLHTQELFCSHESPLLLQLTFLALDEVLNEFDRALHGSVLFFDHLRQERWERKWILTSWLPCIFLTIGPQSGSFVAFRWSSWLYIFIYLNDNISIVHLN